MDGDLDDLDVGSAVTGMVDDLGEMDGGGDNEELVKGSERAKDPDFGAEPAGAGDTDKAAAPPPAAKNVEVPAGTPPAVEALPATWRKDPGIADAWAKAPPELRAEVLRREQNIAQYAEDLSQAANVGKGVEKLFEPLAPWIEKLGVDPWVQTRDLWNMYINFKAGDHDTKLQQIVAFAAEAGLDLSKVGGPAVPDVVLQMQQRIRELEQGVGAVHSRVQQENNEKLMHEITAFSADTEKRPYFWDVVPEMVALFNAKRVGTLDQAYDLAVRLNPVTYAKEVERLATEKSTKAQAEAKARAEAARKASRANVRSSFGRAARLPSGSVDQTLEDTWEKIQARDNA